MATVQEALKAKLLGQEVPTEAAVSTGSADPVQDIVDTKKGYAGEEDVDVLAATLMIHQEALTIMAKEIAQLKSVIVNAAKTKQGKK